MPDDPTSKATQGSDGRKDPPDCRTAGLLDLARVLGPRAVEIAAATQALRGTHTSALQRLATDGRFQVARPLRAPDKFGAEHDVFLTASGSRVIKFARNYGFTPLVENGRLTIRSGKPSEYLARQVLCEQVFPTEIRVDGLTSNGHFVVSQRAIKGEHPTEAAVRKYLLKLGFVNIPERFGQGGRAWLHRNLGVLILDTAPDNFVASKHGMVPVDLIMAELDRETHKLADAIEQLMKQAPRLPK